MKIRLMKAAPACVGAAVLALSLSMTATYAEMEPMAPMNPPAAKPGSPAPTTKAPRATARSNAQLEEEIKSLREQVKQLQQAHGMAPDKQPDQGMPNMPNMPKNGGTKPPAAPPMKKGCMGMGCMEKDDDAMGMPPPDGADPQPMPDAMPHM
jgi:hypothetical protein